MLRLHRSRRDSGFTVVELLFTMILFGIVIAIGFGPYRSYEQGQAHRSTTRKIAGTLRNAQIRAVAEDATYRVTFEAGGRSYALERKSATGWVLHSRYRTDAKVFVRDAVFQQPDGTTSESCYFYPRGSATKGSLVVAREGRTKTYTVDVEGLTARVSYS